MALWFRHTLVYRQLRRHKRINQRFSKGGIPPIAQRPLLPGLVKGANPPAVPRNWSSTAERKRSAVDGATTVDDASVTSSSMEAP